jgi:dihydroxy-acid dehydratase
MENGIFKGKARVFNSERDLLDTLEETPDVFQDNDMVVIRYVGPRGGPGMPEMLDPTSRITTLCREKGITIALMTDARFSGGSVGLVIGHVGPEAFLGGPIAYVEDGDDIVIDIHKNSMDCVQLDDPVLFKSRKKIWDQETEKNGGMHPHVKTINNRLLKRMRLTAKQALDGAGML